MSYISMAKELLGDVPGLNLPYAQTLLGRALDAVYQEQRWSFQIFEGGWVTPVAISAGTITVTPFATTVTGDATAMAAWNALVGRPFITERQIRVGVGALYSIIGYDGAGTLTLDRPWMEPAATLAGYMLYGAYYAVPVTGFRKFGQIRDTLNGAELDFKKRDQNWLARHDPQRMVFDVPRSAVPYRVDTRPGSPTLGNMLYELWPHPTSQWVYPFTGLYNGPTMALPGDTVPYPLTEELVLWRAKEMGFLWKESQRGEGLERGSGADWRFLSQEAHEQFAGRLKQAKLLDMNLGDLYWSKFERDVDSREDLYVTQNGRMNVGTI